MRKGFESFGKMGIEKIENGIKFTAWERTYEFVNSFVPTKITALGEEILSQPVKLNAYFENNEVKAWSDFTYLIHEVTDEKIVVLVTGGCENIIGNATVTIEIDGFVQVDFRLMNYWFLVRNKENFARLQGMDLTINVKNDHGKLFHFWPNAKSSILPDFVFNAGNTENHTFCFKPYVWAGNEKSGLGIFFGDSAEPFEVNDEDKYIEVTKKDIDVEIRLHMLDHMPFDWIEQESDKWVETLETKFFTFGFQATPVKPIPERREELNKISHVLHTRHEVLDNEGIYFDEVIENAAKAGKNIYFPRRMDCNSELRISTRCRKI